MDEEGWDLVGFCYRPQESQGNQEGEIVLRWKKTSVMLAGLTETGESEEHVDRTWSTEMSWEV